MGKPNHQELQELTNKWLKGEITPEEKARLDAWYDEDDEPELQWTTDDAEDELEQRMFAEIQQQKEKVPASKKWRRLIAAAAVALLAGSAGFYFYFHQANITTGQADANNSLSKATTHDLAPGGNKATLTLANGTQINLTNAQNGKLATQANVLVNKTADGQVKYQPDAVGNIIEEPVYNTLATPRGGKYDLTLADGTHVWLNAASSIRYPSSFKGKERIVEVTGEAYFEVVHNDAQPFKVIAAGQTITDIGTRFNINAYNDEPDMRTTLVEGSVKVSNAEGATILTPGQQAIVAGNQQIRLNANANVDEAIAWHRGLFEFNDADIRSMMRQLARWYDVDVIYEGKVSERLFSGKIYRNLNASEIAEILSYKKIHFRIEGRKIIVTP